MRGCKLVSPVSKYSASFNGQSFVLHIFQKDSASGRFFNTGCANPLQLECWIFVHLVHEYVVVKTHKQKELQDLDKSSRCNIDRVLRWRDKKAESRDRRRDWTQLWRARKQQSNLRHLEPELRILWQSRSARPEESQMRWWTWRDKNWNHCSFQASACWWN